MVGECSDAEAGETAPDGRDSNAGENQRVSEWAGGESHDRDHQDRKCPEGVAGDRHDPCGPKVEDALCLGNPGSRNLALERHGERDPDREPRVDQSDGCHPRSTHEKERSGAQERGSEQSSAEVVHAKCDVAPARCSSPRESACGKCVGSERRRPGCELGRAAIPKPS